MIQPAILVGTLIPLMVSLQIPDERSIDALIKKLGSASFEQRQAATSALLKKGLDAVPALKNALKSKDSEVAKRAAFILKKFEERPLQRLKHFIKEGKVDLATELLARWPKGKYEKACWQQVRKLTFKLSESFVERDKAVATFLDYLKDNAPPMLLTRKPSVADLQKDKEKSILFIRTDDQINIKRRLPFGIALSTSDVRFLHAMVSVVCTCGSISLDDMSHGSILVADGDVTVLHVTNSLIIARGNVTCMSSVLNSRIFCGNKCKLNREAGVHNSKITENATKPLGFIQFFDPAKEGITVKNAKAGVVVAKVTKGLFAKAGLRSGDVITDINGEAVKSPEVFRKILRKHYALETEMAFEVQRGGKSLEIKMRPPQFP